MTKRHVKLYEDVRRIKLTPLNIETQFQESIEDSWETQSVWDKFIDGSNIHLGKRSIGWQFSWNFHKEKYYTNKEELLEFIRSGRVVDEYGSEIEVEEFIEMALNWGQPNGHFVGEEYMVKEYDEKGINRPMFSGSEYFDSEVDGLRVSSSVDFC